MTVQHGRSRPQAGSGAELNAIGLPESAQWRTHQDGASYSRQATRILKSTPARPQGHMFVHCKLKQCHPLKLSKSIISVLMFLFHSKIVFTSIVASRIVNKIELLQLCGMQDVRPTPTPLIWKWWWGWWDSWRLQSIAKMVSIDHSEKWRIWPKRNCPSSPSF